MGQDKALLPFLGQPLIARVLERVAPIADEILVTANQPENYRFLGVPIIPDLIPGRGPLGGLYTALSAASQPLVAVIACDMPFINPNLLLAERDLLVQTETDILIPHLEGGKEPFHAIYRRETCLPHIINSVEAGKWRADAWFHHVKLHPILQEDIVKHDPQLYSFWNVNTPQDLQVAIQFASQNEDRND